MTPRVIFAMGHLRGGKEVPILKRVLDFRFEQIFLIAAVSDVPVLSLTKPYLTNCNQGSCCEIYAKPARAPVDLK
jgi:hypothetical protein